MKHLLATSALKLAQALVGHHLSCNINMMIEALVALVATSNSHVPPHMMLQIGRTLRVGGWVKTGREAGAGAFAFLEINDGSCFESIQVRHMPMDCTHCRRVKGMPLLKYLHMMCGTQCSKGHASAYVCTENLRVLSF